MNRSNVWLYFSVFALGTFQTSVSACSVCFGNPDSALGQGARWGVLAMICIITSVLGGISAFFVFLGKRSAAFEKRELSSVSAKNTNKV